MYKLLSGLLISTALTTSAFASPLCDTTETVLFSCSLTNTKTVSVCSKGLNKEDETGYLEYRYGDSSNTELTLPKERSYPNVDNIYRKTLGNSEFSKSITTFSKFLYFIISTRLNCILYPLRQLFCQYP